MLYIPIKHFHITCVLLSGLLFVIRGGFDIFNISWRQWKVLRWLPHFVDTLLLISAIALCVLIQQYPLVHSWLTAKVLALILYIILGVLTLKSQANKPKQLALYLGAIAVFVYMLGVARMHNWHSWLAHQV